MALRVAYQSNLLGDVRAECDSQMLDRAFVATPDYKMLIESSDRDVVVGRRGAGKSALRYALKNYWLAAKQCVVIEITPEEHQIIGTRPLIRLFGDKYNQIKAGARLAWRYALLLEIASALSRNYKFGHCPQAGLLLEHLRSWRTENLDAASRLRVHLARILDARKSPEELIGGLSGALHLNDVHRAVADALDTTESRCAILIDRLDEGYEPDDTGVGLINGIVQAAIDIDTQLPPVRTTVFLRDNIFRSVASQDSDYSRNIEGRVLRLHWDEHLLFRMACQRLKIAFGIDSEEDRKIWNRCTARELQEREGFANCLQFTLYRPRDVLMLLNSTFNTALQHSRDTIIPADLELNAKAISTSRLDDLLKEYSEIIPGLKFLISPFASRPPEVGYTELISSLRNAMSEDSYDPPTQQQMELFGGPDNVIRALYSIGFLGIREVVSGSYTFCHDGKEPSNVFTPKDSFLIHPCYWMALNLTRSALDSEEAAEIHDEYEIAISSETPELRKRFIGQIISELGQVPVGKEGASAFENWCLRAIRIAFAGNLRNIELHPNKSAVQRRDIVAMNLAESGVWKRVHQDYGCRQVIFEVKNYDDLGPAEFRQQLSYLTGDYGRLSFVVSRDASVDLVKGPELEWVREMYQKHHILVVKLTGPFLCSILSKLRSPQKHDAGDHLLNKLLDTYSRRYVEGQPGKAS
jgi:hypothetical protein